MTTKFNFVTGVALAACAMSFNFSESVEAQSTRPAPTPRASRTAVSQAVPNVPVTTSEKQAKIEALQKEVEKYLNEGEINNVYLLLNQIHTLDPSNPPAELALYHILVQVDNISGARSQLEKAALSVPGDPETYIRLASFAIEEERLTEAALLLGRSQQLLEKYQESPARKQNLQKLFSLTFANYAQAKEDWKTALTILMNQEKAAPSDLQLKMRIADVYFQIGDDAHALLKLNEVFAVQPNMLPPEGVLADLYLSRGNDAKALEYMQKGNAKYANNSSFQLVAGKVYMGMGNWSAAQTIVDNVLKQSPKNIDANVLQGNLALAAGDAKKAAGIFSAAIDLDNSSVESGIGYIRSLILCNDPASLKEGLGIASQLAQGFPQDPECLLHFAWALLANGEKEKGAEIIAQIVPQWDEDRDNTCILVDCLYREGERDSAKTVLQKVLDTDKKFILQPLALKLKANLQ